MHDYIKSKYFIKAIAEEIFCNFTTILFWVEFSQRLPDTSSCTIQALWIIRLHRCYNRKLSSITATFFKFTSLNMMNGHSIQHEHNLCKNEAISTTTGNSCDGPARLDTNSGHSMTATQSQSCRCGTGGGVGDIASSWQVSVLCNRLV